MGFNLNYILNKVLPVSTLGLKQRVASRTGTMESNTEEIVLDVNKPVTIDFGEFVVNHRTSVLVRVQQYRAIGSVYLDSLFLLTYAGTTTGFSPELVNHSGSSLLALDIFDTTNDRYKLSMRDVHFPEGVKISMINNTTDQELLASAFVRYREF